VFASASIGVAIENDLRHALERGELEVWYQPEVDPATGHVSALEGLPRQTTTARENLHGIHDRGIAIAIDYFGAGYASRSPRRSKSGSPPKESDTPTRPPSCARWDAPQRRAIPFPQQCRSTS
jgi:predicted signal transduction protein with EAL and GGDEF domain